MNRRTGKSAARKAHADSQRRDRPATDHPAGPRWADPRLQKWFLVVTVLMQSVWIGFLFAMALWRQ